MRREEKVEAVKAKIRDEISTFKQNKLVKEDLSNFDRNTILVCTFVLALEDYCDREFAFTDWYNITPDGETNYIVTEETLDMMLQDSVKIVNQFIVSATGLDECYDNLFYPQRILTDKWIEFELFTILEKCIFENERKKK